MNKDEEGRKTGHTFNLKKSGKRKNRGEKDTKQQRQEKEKTRRNTAECVRTSFTGRPCRANGVDDPAFPLLTGWLSSVTIMWVF